MSAAPAGPSATTDGTGRTTSALGLTAPPVLNEAPPVAGNWSTEVPERSYSRGRGIDRVALARLTQMAWRPPIVERSAYSADAEQELEPVGRASGTGNGGAAEHGEKSSVGDRVADTLLVADELSDDRAAFNGLAENGSAGNVSSPNGSARCGVAHNANGSSDTDTDTDGNRYREHDTSENVRRRHGAAPSDTDGPSNAPAPDGEGREKAARDAGISAVTELSFADLLAGALAAYRES